MKVESVQADTADLLFSQGKLTDHQLKKVRQRQERFRIPQHQAVVQLNFASEEEAYRAYAAKTGVEFVSLNAETLTPAILESTPVKLIFHYRMIPVAVDKQKITLAFSEPPSSVEQGNLRLLLGKQIKVVLSTPSAIHAALKSRFGLGANTIQKLRAEATADDLGREIVFDIKDPGSESDVDANISDFVNQVLLEALKLGATDIHIEPYSDWIRLRYRIDGLMQTVPVPRDLRTLYAALVSRLKIMAGLNISEKRLPHDGRITLKAGGKEYDLRISIVPTRHGEAVCLRVLGRQTLMMEPAELGMDPYQEKLFLELTKLPQGLVLLTGPTGSGKTTTLYSALAQANDEERKIITLEDPVEYQIDGISQIQAREDLGLTFANGLRSILRHDPDVVLIGEIRDAETAEIAVRAAQTGHLVFSTLHTNDSISAVTRLLEMKIDPFLLASSLVCSISQRLARRICRRCAEPDAAINEEIRKEIALNLKMKPDEVQAFCGSGCVECQETGYRGRIAIYEIFNLNEELADMIQSNMKTTRLRALARNAGWQSLREEGWKKVHAGVTSVAEIERLTHRIGGRSKDKFFQSFF